MITSKYNLIGLEDLNVQGMLQNSYSNLAFRIADLSFYELRRQIEYKSLRTGSKVVVAHEYFKSSKTCSCCKKINNELKLSDRKWTCDGCLTTHDRDINAAINLKDYALKHFLEQ